MVKVNGQAHQPRRIYQLVCQQQRLAKSLSIMLALSGGIWLFFGVNASIAANLATCQSQEKIIKQTNKQTKYSSCSTPDSKEGREVSNNRPLEVVGIDQQVFFTTSSTLGSLQQNLTSDQLEQQVWHNQQVLVRKDKIKDITAQVTSDQQVVPSFLLQSYLPENADNIKRGNEQPQELSLPNPEPQLAEKVLEVSQQVTPDLGNLRLQELKVKPSQVNGNSELGNLRLRELEIKPSQVGNSELGNLRLRELEIKRSQMNDDSELGNLRLRELETVKPPIARSAPKKPFTGRLLAQIGYFKTNNVFSGVDPVDDGLISTGITLWGASALGSKTDLIAAVDGNLIRYVNQSEFNYNQLRFRASIRQELIPRMYGEIGWNNQQLFSAKEGDRFLDENSLRFAIFRRDRLTNKLRLDSGYEFRYSGADPDSRSRIINSLSVSLSYYLQQNLRVGIDYLFARSNFTQRDRLDEYHRLLGRLSYGISRDSQLNLQAGVTLGDSSASNIDFDNFFFSITYTLELGEF